MENDYQIQLSGDTWVSTTLQTFTCFPPHKRRVRNKREDEWADRELYEGELRRMENAS